MMIILSRFSHAMLRSDIIQFIAAHRLQLYYIFNERVASAGCMMIWRLLKNISYRFFKYLSLEHWLFNEPKNHFGIAFARNLLGILAYYTFMYEGVIYEINVFIYHRESTIMKEYNINCTDFCNLIKTAIFPLLFCV